MKNNLKNAMEQWSAKFAPVLERVQEFDAKHKQSDPLPPENAVSLRIVATLMAFLVITLACYYANLSLVQTVFYLLLAVVGSYLAYLGRAKRSTLLSWVTITGVLIVMGGFAQEAFFQLYIGKLNLLSPFVIAVAGLQALHLFDLRTRSDINTSAVIGLGCLASAAMIGQDIAFGIGVLLYVFMASLLLYLECVEYSGDGVIKAASSAELFSPNAPPPPKVRGSAGSAVLMVSSLPVLAVFVFLNIPRIESLIDRLVTSTVSAYIPMHLTVASPATSMGGQGDSGNSRGSNVSASGSFGGAANKSTPGTRQFRENPDSDSKTEVRFPAGFNQKGGEPEKGASQNGEEQAENKESSGATAKYSLADKATEEDMTLNYAGKKDIAGSNPLLFVIKSSRDVFLRRLSFVTFDGHDWKAPSQRSEQAFEIKSPDIYTEIDYSALSKSNFHSMDVTQEIEASADLGHIVPAAWAPKMVAIPADKVFVDSSGTMRLKDNIAPGTKFRVVSKVPFYDLDALRGASVSDELAAKIRKDHKADLQIPTSQGDQPALLARGLTNSAGSWFMQAEKICDYLRNNFQYSLDVPPPKKSENLVNYFLFTAKKGDCSHFASAFVILCRSLGIPARCVGGFAPGVRNYMTGNMEVHAVQAHAWAEIYVPNFGWVPFDPVPDGYMPGPKPDQGLIATMMRSEQVKSLTQSFDSFVKARGRASIAGVSNKTGSDDTADGTGTTAGPGKGAATGKGSGKGMGAGSPNDLRHAGPTTGKGNDATPNTPAATPSLPNRFNLTVGGQAGRQSALNGSPLDITFRELFHPPDLLWLFENGTKIITVVLLLFIIGVFLYRFRKFLTPRAKQKALDKTALKPSTLVYLKVIDDLSEIKFVKEPADTPREIVQKVSNLIDNNGIQDGLSELPGILANFMDKYVSNRFVPEESSKSGAELEEIGNKIHVLVTSRSK
jgi:transglutaminase-like putative cysteine protease